MRRKVQYKLKGAFKWKSRFKSDSALIEKEMEELIATAETELEKEKLNSGLLGAQIEELKQSNSTMMEELQKKDVGETKMNDLLENMTWAKIILCLK